jgi:hypothetical protein
MCDPSKYLFGDEDDREYETDFAGFGRTFPHAYGMVDDKYVTPRLTLSPPDDELMLAFAKALFDNEGPGQDEVPGYLAVSFSSTDYVGHVFGASSLESEDSLARLDRTLAELFAYVDDKIGQDTLLFQSVLRPTGQPAEEAVYPAITTADGEPMNANNDYLIRMAVDELPPAQAFWSFTLYDTKNGLFIPNDRKKYSVGENGGMKLNEDGGIEIYIATEKPEGVPSRTQPAIFSNEARAFSLG